MLARQCWVTLTVFQLALMLQPGAHASDLHNASTQGVRTLIKALEFPVDLEVHYSQRQLNPLFKRISEQHGTMSRSATTGLTMRVTHPRPEQRVLKDGTVTLTRMVRNRHTSRSTEVTRRMRLDPNRPSQLVLIALEAFLTGNSEPLEAHFNAILENTDDNWQVVLTPNNEDITRQISRVHFSGRRHKLLNFRSELDDGDGGFTHFLEVAIQASGVESFSTSETTSE